ncbi:unnamed protein product [Agarophyton chilense]|eukprot:gb/GEZJ01000468.1/.p2 GENE.gb/GEZJ01000468.1/~~gb/GEZJ01000468.1/.p2  ORF type:complete len:308 (-),score=54.96 gb/GEZJ01000468.1/:2804-3727(-)
MRSSAAAELEKMQRVFLLLAVGIALMWAQAHAAFSAAHLYWPFLTTAVAEASSEGCARALGKDVQEIEQQGYERGMAALAPQFWFYDGVRCSKWGGVADARVLVASGGGEPDWADGVLRRAARDAQDTFGGGSVAWAEARAGETAATVTCGARVVSRILFVRGRRDGTVRVGANEVTARDGALVVVVEESDGRVCAFNGWTEAPNKRLSVDVVAMDAGGGSGDGGVDGGRVAGGVVGVVALGALLYGATWWAARAARRKEALVEKQGAGKQYKKDDEDEAEADEDGVSDDSALEEGVLGSEQRGRAE